MQRKGGKRTNGARETLRAGQIAVMAAGAVLIAYLAYTLQFTVDPLGLMRAKDETAESVGAKISITEVMTANASAFADDQGQYSDWIELCNTSDESVNLKGIKLAKGEGMLIKYFEFPSHALASGERVLVYCTGVNVSRYGYAYHAPFRLSAAGETVCLYDASDRLLETVEIPELANNQAWAYLDGQWTLTYEYTPLLPNTPESHALAAAARVTAESALAISEIMADNATYAGDDGNAYDYIELINTGDAPVSLKGYALSDSAARLSKWKLPDRTLLAGETLIVYASGTNDSDTHANFQLGAEGGAAILTNGNGQVTQWVAYPYLSTDQAYSYVNGLWTTDFAPTPGYENTFEGAAFIDRQLRKISGTELIISEVMASGARDGSVAYDWVELYNASASAIDLSGYGLSDNPGSPRKWQFPEGTTLNAGKYIGVLLSGQDAYIGGYHHANFRLSVLEGESLVLSDPQGRVLDRAPLSQQYTGVSYGRISGQDGFYYLNSPTPLAENKSSAFTGRADAPAFSAQGGLYDSGATIELTLTAGTGTRVYYTTDCSQPTAASTPYTAPISIDRTTVVRAIGVRDGMLDSLCETQTYFVGESHTVRVVSLVTDPVNLWDENTGLYVKGTGATANYMMDWERAANVEIFTAAGDMIVSQGCGIRIHGQGSRALPQKAFKVIARSEYGDNRFRAKLFPNRAYTEYQSFLLRSTSEDYNKTRMRDPVLVTLAEGSSVMYQDTTMAVVYLNGEYWGQYNMRERIGVHSISQWEGWDVEKRDDIDLVKGNSDVMQGSDERFQTMLANIKQNGIKTPEALEAVKQTVDVYNYLQYVAVQMFTGNTDTLNVKRYCSKAGDGLWKWALFDLDWAFYTDTDSVTRWLTPGGVGNGNRTDNTLFVCLMQNAEMRDWYLTYFADKMATDWTSGNLIQKFETYRAELLPELDRTLEKWSLSRDEYDSQYRRITKYANERPGRLLYFFSQNMSEQDFTRYFGEVLKNVSVIAK